MAPVELISAQFVSMSTQVIQMLHLILGHSPCCSFHNYVSIITSICCFQTVRENTTDTVYIGH
uniref:Uncharacterized protein n=1 Tax=Triticum urartu TaxID=4572 RepID=A0A8R7PMB3_TRIUA